jgi:signal transduction histidine kinase
VREERDSYIPSKIQLTEAIHRLKLRTERRFPQLSLEVSGNVAGIHLNITEEKLYTIFTNLIDNAAFATGEVGTVRLNFSFNENRMIVSVEDNGTGIPIELRRDLFKAMHKGKNPSGTGMGLSIVKAFVMEEGGTISYDESFNHGARFLIELPIEKAKD